MGYVQQYGNDRWRARKRVGGKLVSKSFATRAEAFAWADDEVQVGLQTTSKQPQSALVGAPQSQLTLGEFWDQGGHVTVHMRPTTQDFVQTLYRVHIRPHWANTPLAAIRHDDLQRWLLQNVAPGRSPTTVKHVAKVAHQILNSAVRAGYISVNPAAGLKTPRPEHEEMRFLNTDEIKALATAIDERYSAYVYLAAYTGLRIGEALALRWPRLDLFAGKLEVAETVSEVRGRLIVGPPKTRSSRRVVSIPRSVVRVMSDHRNAVTGNVGGTAWVFPGPDGGIMQPSNFRRRVWTPATAAVGLTGLRPHDLRHTAVALWIAAGASPKEVAARAGHTSVSFSLDRYGHLYPVQDERLAGKLDRIFNEGI